MYKRVISVLLVLVSVFMFALPTYAADSYSHVDIQGNRTEIRLSDDMYCASRSINASDVGLSEKFDGITDIYCDRDNSVLLLCGGNSKLFRINAAGTSGEEITVTDDNGEPLDYTGAQGIWCDKDGSIYICDTSNARIVITDGNGKIQKILSGPDAKVMPENFLYQPASIIKDADGYTYILSMGCYYGALMYSVDNEYMGFYGPNTVKTTALDTLSYLWDRLTSNEVKRNASVKKLPYSFVDFCFDSEGFMVTCTGNTEKTNGTGQIRRISHNGADILYKRTLTGQSISSTTFNFLEETEHDTSMQNLVSIAVNPENYIFALDRTTGRIYLYDSECNLMSVFGGGMAEGEQLGVFKTAVSLTFQGEKLLVADSDNCNITVFEETEYGKLLTKAQTTYLNGDYVKAEKLWKKTLSLNRNCQLAYRGMAMAYYNEGNYKAALKAAEIAVDYSVYSMAWSKIVSQYIARNFVWILLLIAAVAVGITVLFVQLKKRHKRLINNQKIRLLLELPFHPYRSFEELKYKKRGSVTVAVVLTVLLYVSSVLRELYSGFLFNSQIARNYNALYTLAGTVGILLLWCVCNWLVCSMFSGKGSFSEVYIATTYAFFPYILFNFVRIIFTNFVPLSATGLINEIETALIIYSVFLLIVGMLAVHEYDFFKFLLTGIVVILFMVLVVFVLLMCSILIKQFIDFVISLYEEIIYR